MKKLIRVTDDDIANGICGGACDCPVARALKRTFGTDNVSVGFAITVGNARHPLPRSVDIFMTEFDNDKTVKPFNFYLQTEGKL